MATDGPNTKKSTDLMSELAATSYDRMLKAQRATFEQLHELNRHWLDRWQAEAKVFTDFSAKLMAARSLPEATKAYQDLAEQQWKMTSEDSRRIIEDGEALTRNGVQLFTSGWSTQQGLST